ncbi:MAG: hypothetical protein AAGG69_14375 [Pseudomonadota bacterium]
MEINRVALLGVVSVLFGYLSVGEADGTVFLSARARRRILRLLVPCETALRRLIYICVRVFKISTSNAASERKCLLPNFALFATVPEDVARAKAFKLADSIAWPSWSLIDANQKFQSPEIANPIGGDDTELTSCTDLLRRAKAMEAVLKNLKTAARRMAREDAKRTAAPLGKKCLPVLRRIPPGRRQNGREEVDAILRECNGLACDVERWPP